MRRTNILFLALVLGPIVATTAGCVTGTRSVSIPAPEHVMAKTVTGSISIGEISDARHFEDKPRDPSTPSVRGGLASATPEKRATLIGRQRNGYGKAMGDVDLPDGRTVQDEVRELLERGLAGRGYRPSNASPNRMDVEIEEFWAWFTPGMWMISFEAEILTRLRIATPDGSSDLEVKGYGVNKGQVASDANWALAYQRAYNDFLKNLETALEAAGF